MCTNSPLLPVQRLCPLQASNKSKTLSCFPLTCSTLPTIPSYSTLFPILPAEQQYSSFSSDLPSSSQSGKVMPGSQGCHCHRQLRFEHGNGPFQLADSCSTSVQQYVGILIGRPPFLVPHLQERMTSHFRTQTSLTTKMTSTSTLLRLLPPEEHLFSRISRLFPIWPILRLSLPPACILSMGLDRAHPILPVLLSCSKPKGR